MHKISMQICELLSIRFIDFSEPENFVKLMDLIFQYKKIFQLIMYKRTNSFLEDTLALLADEIIEAKTEKPLQVKEFSSFLQQAFHADADR